MFSYISSHLTDATVPDWSSFWEPKWFWSVTNNCGTLSLDVNIKLGHDLPVDVRNASIFGSWLSGRGDVWFVSIPALEGLFLIWMFSAWFTQLGFLVPSGSSQFTIRTACSAWDVASVPQNLWLQGLRIRRTALQRVPPPFPQNFLPQWE